MDLKTMGAKQISLYAAICGAVVFVGVLLPWYSVSYDFGAAGGLIGMAGRQSHSWNGTEGEFMGTFTLILGILAGGLALLTYLGKAGALPFNAKQLAFVVAGAFGLATLLTFIDLMRRTGDVSGTGVSAGKSFGIYLTFLAAIAGTGLSVLLIQKSPAPPPGATPPPPAPGAPPPPPPPAS